MKQTRLSKILPGIFDRQLHYASGLIIALFVGMHLCNHLAALDSLQAHIRIMKAMRVIYRNPVIEVFLMIAVLVQIISGIKLWRQRRKLAFTFFERLHIWTGLYLAFFFIVHVSAVMMGRYVQHLDTNIYFGIAGLNTFPFTLFFYPYYFLSVFCFTGHIACVHRMKMQSHFLGITPHGQSLILLWFGVAIGIILLYGFTNGFSGVEIPGTYKLN